MHKSTVIPTITALHNELEYERQGEPLKNVDCAYLTPHLFFFLNTHSKMTNFITLPIPLSERSELKPNYHTRAKLKAFPLNGCNPSPDK